MNIWSPRNEMGAREHSRWPHWPTRSPPTHHAQCVTVYNTCARVREAYITVCEVYRSVRDACVWVREYEWVQLGGAWGCVRVREILWQCVKVREAYLVVREEACGCVWVCEGAWRCVKMCECACIVCECACECAWVWVPVRVRVSASECVSDIECFETSMSA